MDAQNEVTKVTYLAERDETDRTVEARKLLHLGDTSLRSASLPPRLDLRSHSPAGFEFGYGGSGPAQLSLAILADAVGPERAVDLYQDFKRAFVARAEGDEFRVTKDRVLEWVAAQTKPPSDALDAWAESTGE